MAWSAAVQTEMGQPTGERMMPRLKILLKTGSTVTLTDTEHCLDVTSIERRRERQFGVVQAQSWTAALTNASQYHYGRQLVDCYVALDVGFPTDDIWDRAATGRVRKATAGTDGRLVLEMQEPLRDLVDARLERDMYFGTSGWLSEIQPKAIGDGSKAYDGSPTTSAHINLADETFRIVFATATTYYVYNGDDDEYGPFGITSAATFGNAANPSSNIITIPASGWSTDSGDYAADDEYVFYTSEYRVSGQLSTIGMVQHLIEDVAGIKAYDFDTETEVSPIHDSTEWSRVKALVSDDTVGGLWRKGSRVVDMVQQLLSISHASIYPTAMGTIGVWILEQSGASTLVLNGDPARGNVTILGASISDDIGEAYGSVEYKYLTMGGEDASVSAASDDADTDAPGRELSINIGWRVRGVSMNAAASKALNRFRRVSEVVSCETTLYGALAELANGVTIHEPGLALSNWRSDVVAVSLDVINNKAAIEAQVDPVSLEDYFIVGESLLGSEVIW